MVRLPHVTQDLLAKVAVLLNVVEGFVFLLCPISHIGASS
jgi:hypothetical protein